MANRMVIGIGDLHGDIGAFGVLLDGLHKRYGIFSDLGARVLSNGIELTQMGDYVDRYPYGREVIKLSRELKSANPEKVHQLMGNHELLALSGIDRARRILEEEYESEMYYAYAERTAHGNPDNGGCTFIREFGNTPGEAFRNYVGAMEGDMGSWMRNLLPMKIVSLAGKEILFVHAGIPEFIHNREELMQYEEKVRNHLATEIGRFGDSKKKYGDKQILGKDSIFWNRRFNKMRKSDADRLVENLGLDYLVIGHNHKRRIKMIGHKAFNIDIGMSWGVRGNDPAAIVFKPSGVYAFYVGAGEKQLIGGLR